MATATKAELLDQKRNRKGPGSTEKLAPPPMPSNQLMAQSQKQFQTVQHMLKPLTLPKSILSVQTEQKTQNVAASDEKRVVIKRLPKASMIQNPANNAPQPASFTKKEPSKVQQAGLEIIKSPVLSPTTPKTPSKLVNSPSTRVRNNLLLDKPPKQTKQKVPPKSKAQQEYLTQTKPIVRKQIVLKAPNQNDDRGFSKVLSQIKLLDTSQSCRLLEALKNSKSQRFKLLGKNKKSDSESHKEYMTPTAVRMRAFNENSTPNLKLLMTAQSVQSLMSHHSSINTPVKPSREIRMLQKPYV